MGRIIVTAGRFLLYFDDTRAFVGLSAGVAYREL